MSRAGDPFPTEDMTMVKTTKEHFKKFKNWFMHYVELYGIKDWRFDIVHGDCGHAYSTCNANSYARVVTVCFNRVWSHDDEVFPVTEASIRETAKHEAHEMLVMDLYCLVSEPYKTKDEAERIRHTLVRRLDSVVV